VTTYFGYTDSLEQQANSLSQQRLTCHQFQLDSITGMFESRLKAEKRIESKGCEDAWEQSL
jgi:hypothetical protein